MKVWWCEVWYCEGLVLCCDVAPRLRCSPSPPRAFRCFECDLQLNEASAFEAAVSAFLLAGVTGRLSFFYLFIGGGDDSGGYEVPDATC